MNTQPLTRTTISLHPTILQRLKTYADQQGTSISAVVEQGIRRVLAQTEPAQLQHLYTVLGELEGTGGEGLKDVSTTINETLYGEHGSWKGEND